MKNHRRAWLRPWIALGAAWIAVLGANAAVPLGSVVLEWDPNPEPDIAGYRVHYGTESRSYDYFLDVGTTTRVVLSNLEPDKAYFIALTAYNSADLESDYSPEAVAYFQPAPASERQGRLVLLEAEDGDVGAPLEIRYEAGTGFLAGSAADGTAAQSFAVPVPGSWDVWARVRRVQTGGGYEVSIGGEPAGVLTGDGLPAGEWSWRKLGEGPIELEEGESSLELNAISAGLEIDRLVLSSHRSFEPDDALPTEGVLKILRQPIGRVASEGASVNLDVELVSTEAVSFEWSRNGEPVPGGTNALLELDGLTPAQQGGYRVELRAGDATVTSEAALVSVLPPSPIRVMQVASPEAGQVRFDVVGEYGPSVNVYVSENLADWSLLATSPVGYGTVSVPDPEGVGKPRRFYRLESPGT